MRIPQHTTEYKLKNYKFSFSIPALHFYSAEYQKEFGVTSSGDKGIDRMMMDSMVGSRDTILEMAKLYDKDVTIRLDDPKDSVRIYEIVKEHLDNWNRAAQTEHNLGDIPMDELRMLDEFAGSIQTLARRYKPDVGQKSKFFERTRNMGAAFDRRGAVQSEEKPKAKLKEHHPVFSTIEEHLERRNIRWN